MIDDRPAGTKSKMSRRMIWTPAKVTCPSPAGRRKSATRPSGWRSTVCGPRPGTISSVAAAPESRCRAISRSRSKSRISSTLWTSRWSASGSRASPRRRPPPWSSSSVSSEMRTSMSMALASRRVASYTRSALIRHIHSRRGKRQPGQLRQRQFEQRHPAERHQRLRAHQRGRAQPTAFAGGKNKAIDGSGQGGISGKQRDITAIIQCPAATRFASPADASSRLQESQGIPALELGVGDGELARNVQTIATGSAGQFGQGRGLPIQLRVHVAGASGRAEPALEPFAQGVLRGAWSAVACPSGGPSSPRVRRPSSEPRRRRRRAPNSLRTGGIRMSPAPGPPAESDPHRPVHRRTDSRPDRSPASPVN